MITASNSLCKGSGMPNHYVGDLLHTMAISGLSRVRTELLKLAVVESLTPHPVDAQPIFEPSLLSRSCVLVRMAR